MKTERIIRLFLAVLVLFVMAAAKEVGAVTWCYEDDFSTQKAANDNYDSSGFWPEMALPPPHPYLFYSSVIYPGGLGGLGFASYYTEDAFLAYAFPVGGGLVRVDSGTLEVDVLGSSHLSYELSDDGANWTEQSSLVEGHNQIPLLPSDNPFTYIRFVGSGVGIDNLSVTVTGPKVEGTYVFLPQYSTVIEDGGIMGAHNTYSIEGRFQLAVDFDANTASFDHVDANLSESTFGGYGRSLDNLFDMTELVGTVVSSTEIEFDTADPIPGGKVVHLDLTFADNSVHLTGGFCEPWVDGFCYYLDARAQKLTVNYLSIDDFESYNNDAELRVEWKDNSVPGSPPRPCVFLETNPPMVIDSQSMKLVCWNIYPPYYSEARHTFAQPQDWSPAATDARLLAFSYYGKASNPADYLYIRLEDSDGGNARQQVSDANAVKVVGWTELLFALNAFDGVNLAKISKIIIGVGPEPPVGVGSGTVYIWLDNVRLYPPGCHPGYLRAAGDINADCITDFDDLEQMALQWLSDEPDGNVDLYPDGCIDFKDFAVLGETWLQELLFGE